MSIILIPIPLNHWNGLKSIWNIKSFDMKIEESSNEGNLLTGCETRLFPSKNHLQLPIAFSKFVPEFCNQIITMSNIPPHVDKEALEAIWRNFPDSEIEITSPNPDKSFYRLAWLKLPDNSIEKVSELVPKLESLGSIEGAKSLLWNFFK